MTTLIKFIIATVLSLTLFSCNFDMNFNNGVNGNGNVTTENRNLNASFTSIEAAEGLDVYITQGDNESISVEADENLHDLILTDIDDGVLSIHTKENIGRSSSKKIHVSFKGLSSISTSSGSRVTATQIIAAKRLDLKASSGSQIKIEVNMAILNCDASSGSALRISGKTVKLLAEASSGSSIKAADLMAESSIAKASSGASVTVNTSNHLTADASSGGQIKYYGNPEHIEKSNHVSGSIKKL